MKKTKQKCPICGVMRNNLDSHMKNHGEQNNNPPEAEIIKEYATRDDLDKVLGAITDIAKTVNDLVKKQANPIIIEKTVPEIAGTADLSKVKESNPTQSPAKQAEDMPKKEGMPIPPDWRKMVDEMLGMDFGIDVVYPQSGSGFLFKVIVPEEKSNMSKDYKEFYKVDIRTKAINYNEGVDGIRKFCEGVKKNLEKKQS
jgi:hypothetical protein